jgi:hypothetical protein
VEFREVLRRRRMVRNYTEEPVDPAAVSRIAAAALRAPSAGYSQGLAVVAITDAATRGRIAEAAGEAGYVARGFDPWVSRAPVHLVISVSEAAYHRRYRMPDKLDEENREISWPVPYWWVDAGAALMAVLLAAVDEGLAAGFLGAHAVHRSGRCWTSPTSMRRSGSLPSVIRPPTAAPAPWTSAADRRRRCSTGTVGEPTSLPCNGGGSGET